MFHSRSAEVHESVLNEDFKCIHTRSHFTTVLSMMKKIAGSPESKVKFVYKMKEVGWSVRGVDEGVHVGAELYERLQSLTHSLNECLCECLGGSTHQTPQTPGPVRSRELS